MKGVNPATEGIVWLRVGGNDGIATSKPLIVNKPEGTHSTTTDSCYSCHIDYSTSPLKHPSYVASGMDSEVAFVEGCLVCHGSVSRAVVNAEGFSTGSYATNTLSKIGHINHQKFTKDFSVMNCTSCHVEAPNNINVSGPGCIDCHNSGGVPGVVIPSNGADLRIMHESKAGITERQAICAKYKLSLSTPVKVDDISTKTDHYIDGTAISKVEPSWCTTLTVKDTDGNVFSIKDNFNYSSPLVYDAKKPEIGRAHV